MAFREVYGHRQVLGLLARAVARGTLMPSLVLSGPEGVGKRLTAISIAQALNCARPAEGDACGDCAACRRILRQAYPDVQVIRPGESGSIKIDEIRDAIANAVYRPFEGRRRVTIIEEADALQPGAQNALLKTLEEPLPASVFVLVTSRPDSLLPTVRSRCAHLRFGRLSAAEVAGILEHKHGWKTADAVAAAAVADGSVQRALQLESGALEEARRDVERLLRVAGRDMRARLDTAKDLLKGSGTAAAEREHLGARIDALQAMLRDAGLVGSRADERHLANLDRQPLARAVADSLGTGRIDRIFAATVQARDALDRNVSPKVVADWLAVQL